MDLRCSFVVAVLAVVAGCWGSVPAPANAPVVEVAAPPARPRTIVPSVRVMSDAEWRACETCDDQELEGGVPLRYAHLPAVTVDGSVIAVIEERDGWGAVPVPGIRLIDRTGATLEWLRLDGTGDAAEANVAEANVALARRRWLALAVPKVSQRQLSDTEVETTLALERFDVVYRRRDEGNFWLPPSSIRVSDRAGRVVLERTDTERAWLAPPRCNLPRFELVGASGAARTVVFRTWLGLGSHRCDGIEQRPTWHVLAW